MYHLARAPFTRSFSISSLRSIVWIRVKCGREVNKKQSTMFLFINYRISSKHIISRLSTMFTYIRHLTFSYTYPLEDPPFYYPGNDLSCSYNSAISHRPRPRPWQLAGPRRVCLGNCHSVLNRYSNEVILFIIILYPNHAWGTGSAQ